MQPPRRPPSVPPAGQRPLPPAPTAGQKLRLALVALALAAWLAVLAWLAFFT